MNNKSPLRYPGGKTRACVILEKILLEHFDLRNFDKLISPFFGGGSFEFFLQNKYDICIVANDKFTPLISFWKQCQKNYDELCNEIIKDYGKVTKETFRLYRNSIMNCKDELHQAVMFFIINRSSFSGATLSGGFSKEAAEKRFTKSSIDTIRKLNLSKFSIDNLDFQDFLSNHTEGLLFVDPPYYFEKKNSNLYGFRGDLHETFPHEKLYEVLSKRNNWILTYNDCKYIRDLYKNYLIIEVNWGYGMNKSKKSSEIVILKRL